MKTSRPLFDRAGWFAALQRRAQASYPEPLRRNIVAKNHPILRSTQSSYLHQLEIALERHDAVSVNHRTAALLASFFDIVFALNRQPHPGEKRLLEWSTNICPMRPANMEQQIPEILSDLGAGRASALLNIHKLLDDLDELLRKEQLIP